MDITMMQTAADGLLWKNIIIVCVYMLALIGIGLYMNRRVKSSEDYWVGGRSVGPVVTAMSYCAAFYSTVAVIGGPSTGYRYGLPYLIPNILGATVTTGILIFLFLALKMRVVSERSKAVSLPGFLAVRYDCSAIRYVTAILIAVMMIPYSVSVLKGIADGFEVLAGVPYKYGVIIICAVAVLYMMFSGYWGVAVTDMVQGILIALGMLLLTIFVVNRVGGLSEMFAAAAQNAPDRMTDMPGLFGNMANCLSVAWVWQLIAFGQPQLVTKFMGVKDSRTVGAMVRTSVPWIGIFLTCSSLLAVGGLAIFGTNVQNSDTIAPALAFLSGSTLIQSLFLIAAVAAGLSTLVSLVLTSAAAITRDIYEDGILAKRGKTLDSKKSINISRVITIIILAISGYLALDPWDFVWEMSTMAGGTMGAAFVAATFVGLHWKGATKIGAVSSVVIGAVVTLFWYQAGLSSIVHPFLPGMTLSIISLFVISHFTKKLPQNTIDMFFKKDYHPAAK